MKTITLQLALICVLLCACKETSNDLTQKSEKKEALNELKEALNKLTEDKAADQEEITNDSNHDVTIKFADLTISLKDINVFWWEAEGNNTDNVYETEKDTAFFDLNPGDEVFEKSFRIEQTAFDIIELYGQFEIKVALETKRELEVPVCILENWKGYTSKWIKLKIDHKSIFRIMVQ